MVQYREEIDGLRALAVLPVIFSHAGMEYFSGGYVGVDVFFVISGYLITGIIFTQLNQGDFSFKSFYVSRAKRILPALYLMFAVTTVASWHLMIRDDLAEFGESLQYASAFVANLYFKNKIDYFTPATETLPLLHTWSLAVEEQYYFIFPVLLFLIWKNFQEKFNKPLWIAMIVSFLLCLIGSINFKISNYYLLPTRSWELLLGGVIFTSKESIRSDQVNRMYLPLSGILMIILCVVTFDRQTPYPSIFTLFPVIGAALVLCGVGGDPLSQRILTAPPVMFIGKISYSLYLWHFPILALAIVYQTSIGIKLEMAWLILLVFFVSTLSYLLIERPARNNKNSVQKLLISLVLIGSFLFFTGLILNKNLNSIKPYSITEQTISNLFEETKTKVDWYTCSTKVDNPCEGGDLTASEAIVLFGDSHAFAIFEVLSEEMAKKSLKLILYTDGDCPPIFTLDAKFSKEKCFQNNRKIYEKIKADNNVKAVFLVARWAWYLESTPFDNLSGGIGSKPSYFLEKYYRGKNRREAAVELVSETLDYISAIEKQFFIIDTIPEPGWHVKKRALYLSKRVGDIDEYFEYQNSIFYTRNAGMTAILKRASGHANIAVISPVNIFCGADKNNRCVAWFNGRPLYFDDNHLNNEGAKLLVPEISHALSVKLLHMRN